LQGRERDWICWLRLVRFLAGVGIIGEQGGTSPGEHLAEPFFEVVARGHASCYVHRVGAFPVSPEKESLLAQRMTALGVSDSDIEETFVRSGGHGGQNVNKSATCVMLLHIPSGLQVKCQTTRQQGLNRFLARRILLDKIEALQKGRSDSERARIEKIRRQKRKRSRRAKDRMLADKSQHSEKKAARRDRNHDY
jgi:protein subunit release factor A